MANKCFIHKRTDELGRVVNDEDGNPIMDSTQMTIGWHVDDFLITHRSQEVIDELVGKLDRLYGTMDPLKVHTGDVHLYLGMTLDFQAAGKVKVKMYMYVLDLLESAPHEFDGTAETPVDQHLFNIDSRAERLDPEKATTFHHLVAKCLFLCKRSRPDLQLAVGFLCGRVRQPERDDWKKLRRLFQYLRSTSRLFLTLEAEEVTVPKWWVDASFAVHQDCRSHSGGVLSLGKGAVYSSCLKQRLNGKSSTKAELIAVDDFIGQVLCTKYFLEAQGYAIKRSVVLQDNKSAILLENNARMSGSKRTRHINIRYYFITDRVKAGEVEVQHCPADQIVADFFTKPL